MVNITNIPVAKPIPRLVKWKVLRVDDPDEPGDPGDPKNPYSATNPRKIIVTIQVYGPNDVPWPYPFDVVARDNGQCKTLSVTASPTGFLDQFTNGPATLAGTEYEVIHNAWNQNTVTGPGTKAGRRESVENALLSSGLMSSAFARQTTG